MLSLLLTSCGSEAPEPDPQPALDVMHEHAQEFTQEVIEVAPGVHVAVGFGLANSVLLEGDDGIVVVDTMESVEAAADVADAFRARSDKPLKALVYTHNHGDHTFGSGAFRELFDGAPRVLAHDTTAALIDRLLNVVRPIIGRRSLRMFGTFLGAETRVHCGIGKELRLDADSHMDVIRPTETFSDSWIGSIAGLDIELHHAPGETDDQLFVWLPEQKILLPGDNLYRTFPNLYTIRGTSHRDVQDWVQSLDHMRALKPEILIPSHSRPIVGAETVYNVLTDYRDAIQFVHDQTVRGMNQGLGPDELVERVRLPQHLAASPFLQEHYGTVAWSVRSIFHGYVGWFDGDPAHLDPHGPAAEAERMVTLAGGRDAFLTALQTAEAGEDWPWVLELAGHLHRFDGSPEATAARVRALEALGRASSNPNARNTYLTRARELRDGIELFDVAQISEDMLHSIPLSAFFQNLAVNLDADATLDRQQTVSFYFPDVDRHFTVYLRRGVAEIQAAPADAPDLAVTLPSTVFKDLLAKRRGAVGTLASSELEMTVGNRLELGAFLRLFAAEEAEDPAGWTW